MKLIANPNLSTTTLKHSFNPKIAIYGEERCLALPDSLYRAVRGIGINSAEGFVVALTTHRAYFTNMGWTAESLQAARMDLFELLRGKVPNWLLDQKTLIAG